jgi:hypothetical protein
VEIAYDLTPDGLQFQLPVTVMLALGPARAPDGSLSVEFGLLSAASASGAEVVPLTEQQVLLDGVNDTSAVSGPLRHFSQVIQEAGPAGRVSLSARVEPGTRLALRQSFTPVLTFVSRLPQRLTVSYDDLTPRGGVIEYAGPAELVLGEVEVPSVGQVRMLTSRIEGYGCGDTPGSELYNGRVRTNEFEIFGEEVVLSFRVTEGIGCAAAPGVTTTTRTTTTTTRTTTTGGGGTTSTTRSTTTSTTTMTIPVTTTTTTTTSSTTTTLPCTLDRGATPPQCGGDCPPLQICRFSDGRCQCLPTSTICGGQVCDGVCPSPDDRCGKFEPEAPCTCIFCTRAEGGACVGACSFDQGTCRDIGGTCTCAPEATTTTTASTTTTTTVAGCPRLDVIASPQPPQIALGGSFDFEIPVTGGVAPITLQISSQGEPLPPGCSFDGRRVTGTPIETGVFQVLIEGFDSCPRGVQFDAEFFNFVVNPPD